MMAVDDERRYFDGTTNARRVEKNLVFCRRSQIRERSRAVLDVSVEPGSRFTSSSTRSWEIDRRDRAGVELTPKGILAKSLFEKLPH